MRNLFYTVLLLLSFSFASKAALYQSPGTGVNWTLNDLVANSSGSVTFDGTQYLFIDSVTIRPGDVIRIETDVVVKFNPKVVFKINGTIIINPPTGVLFSAAIAGTSFRGLWLENSTGSSINKLTYEYASSLRLSDCSPPISNSIIRFNTDSTVLSSSALSLFRSSPVITNCQFLNNYRPAIITAPNIENAPKISGCIFTGNNTLNLNNAQIVLGSSGADTSKIIGCTITNPGGVRVGGITVTTGSLGIVHVVINSNNISGNRYGVNLAGGADVNAMVSYNLIANNNIENNPNLGGSGIAFSAGSSTSQQNSIVTGNIIQGNLWGITIQNRSRPNIGNLNNADTSDDGKNKFINNTNATTQGIDLYNNSVDPIFAMGNYWNTNIPSEVEGKIFHQFDNPVLGLVNYGNFVVPVTLISFNGNKTGNNVELQWQTAQESNSDYFSIEKSYDGLNFLSITNVDAAGNSTGVLNYTFTDQNANPYGGQVYYRLKLVDEDGSFIYSSIISINFTAISKTELKKYYPTIIPLQQPLIIELAASKNQPLYMQYLDASGKILGNTQHIVTQGFNKLSIQIPGAVKGGVVFIKMSTADLQKTIQVVVQ